MVPGGQAGAGAGAGLAPSKTSESARAAAVFVALICWKLTRAAEEALSRAWFSPDSGKRQMSPYRISRNAQASGSRQNRGLAPGG
jgi:hypothetical protein